MSISKDNFTKTMTVLTDEETVEKIEEEKFAWALSIAEHNGMEVYRQAIANGQLPRRWRIKLDGSWPEEYIKNAVKSYHESGWTKVTDKDNTNVEEHVE